MRQSNVVMVISGKDFNAALQIYLDKPQVVNRRTGGCVLVCQSDFISPITADLLEEFVQQCTENIQHQRKPIEVGCGSRLLELCAQMRDDINDEEGVTMLCRRYVSKQSNVTFPHEIIIRGMMRCQFIPVEFDDDSHSLVAVGVAYCLSLNPSTHSIMMDTVDTGRQLSSTTTSKQWLHSTLLPRITKWAETGCDQLSHASSGTSNNSMRCIDVEVYYSKYTVMKDKYGKAICEIWPECTDPLKFVYEDVAIACYLICLWERERKERILSRYQTFADLGCGNGLLVYILTQEGYIGFGIDVRKRKIWEKFEGIADLRELSLDPASVDAGVVFRDVDWLIGNHSDELTPWIPVLSARVSRHCQFFLLPCCPHNFYSKYQRIDPRKSVYAEYLQFVCDVVTTCGFDYDRDSMRIPSTKKECIIGWRIWSGLTEEDHTECEMAISDMLSRDVKLAPAGSESGAMTAGKQHSDDGTQQVPAAGFTPRSQVEAVRNCATVSHRIQSLIVTKLADRLLQTQNYMHTSNRDSTGQRQWNRGGEMPLGDVASLYADDIMKSLKTECGGLKTLLKNHHNIFKVVGGRVRLADFLSDPRRLETVQSVAQYKTRLCWFNSHHPDGCVLTAEECRYAHGDNELRAKAPHK